jgi:exopolyphosphatase/guanosine-5'-triphosphate,3'-diphosphate pyrophosphatase
LFASEERGFDRLRRAACYLADTGWRGHPDHRAELVFTLVLNSPFIGIDHNGRALLALAMFHRYGGEDDRHIKRVQRFVGDEIAERAETLGRALRAALVLAGPAPGLLAETNVKLTQNTLVLTVPRARQALIGEAINKRLEDLAEALDRTVRVELR